MADNIESDDQVWGEERPAEDHPPEEHRPEQRRSEEPPPTELPPQYTASAGANISSRPTNAVPPPLPTLPYHKYCLKNSALSADETTVVVKDPRYASDPQALVRMLREQAALPPKPVICIKGSHNDFDRSRGRDFYILMNMTPYIWRDPDKEPLNYSRISPPTGSIGPKESQLPPEKGRDATLEQWAERFCRDPAPAKRIILKRRVVNWDTDYIAGAIRNLICSPPLNYKGVVEVSFPMEHRKIVYQVGELTLAQGLKSWWNSLASGSKSPSKGASDFKDYDILESIWPFATASAEEMGAGADTRRFTVTSEAGWWQLWKATLRNVVLEGRCGWVGMEDWTSTAMGRVVGVKSGWGHDRI